MSKKRKIVKKDTSCTTQTKDRCLIIIGIIGLLFAYVICALVYRVVFMGKTYKKLANEQVINEIEINAKRGRILDRNGQSLAVSGDVYRADIDLVTLEETFAKKAKAEKDVTYYKKYLSKELSTILEVEEEEIIKKLDAKLESGAKASSVILARQISKEKADAIKELGFYGIIVSHDTKRYYPNDEFSSYVIGNVNSDGEGLNGIEMYYNEILAGVPGVRIASLDGSGELELPLEKSTFTPAVNGKDVILTIDEKIQYFAERAANKTLDEHDADSVNILVTDPNTNEILALASSPAYNPNKPYEGFEKFKGDTESEQIQQMWRNKIISDTYEPGSTFKIVTASAAVEEGLANKGEHYICNGFTIIDGQRINCWKREGHGSQTFSQIVENSCNMGFIALGQKLGKEKLYEYIQKFGLESETGIDITGESKGIVKKPDDISDIDLATIAFGQTNAVNMVQLITAFNASINGGYVVTPHLMKDITSTTSDGAIIINDSYKQKKTSVISEETSNTMKTILENVVTKGTGKTAFIEGFKVMGKTGTAEKVKTTGGYGEGRVASFIAGAPADNPKISILVTVDNPKKGVASGSSMAAPAVKEILESVYSYNEIGDVEFNDQKDIRIIMPEVRGMKSKDAKTTLEKEGLNVKISGSGDTVKTVDVLPGSLVKKESTINIELTKGSKVDQKVVVPDFSGYSKDMVDSTCAKIGLVPKYDIKEGNVKKQSTEAGQTIKTGEDIKFILDKNKEN